MRSHREGICKNGGGFKLQRHHLKQLYLRLTYVTPPPHTHTHETPPFPNDPASPP